MSEGRRNNNNRYNKGGKNNNNNHRTNNGGGKQLQYPDMTILCHRVDLFDDFVPSNSGANNNGNKKSSPSFEGHGLVPIRCLGVERGCACHTPCVFCHTVVESDDDEGDDTNTNNHTEAPEGIHPGFAFLFAGNANGASNGVQNNTSPPNDEVAETTNTTTVILDPIFAKNYGLYDKEGGLKVKKFHHPPIGRYNFGLPLQELPAFFDHDSNNDQNNHNVQESVKAEPTPPAAAPAPAVNNQSNNEDDDGGAGLDSFFDDFAIAPTQPATTTTTTNCDESNENKHHILVFRTPLKTVVKKTIKSAQSASSGKCLCQSRYENLKAGNSQPNPHDPSVVHDKYWAQRRRLFKRFDQGIELDAEGWYSVTPEVVADHVASRFQDAFEQFNRASNNNGRNRRGKKSSNNPMVILDAFCGCGGNAIAFAKLPSSVVSHIICIDVDRTKLRKAAHNASIYGIAPNRIVFVEANSVAVMERYYRDGSLEMDPPDLSSPCPQREVYDDFTIGGIDILSEVGQRIDCIFMDPPWGGIDYNAMGKDGYDLARDMKIRGCERGCIGFPPTPEVDGFRLLKIAAAATRTRFVVYDLPRNTNKRSLAEAALEAGYEGNGKLDEHYINNRLKTVTAYFGLDFRHLLDLKKYEREGTL
ncbi:hypothetical protein ACHAWC_006115 [Mediolabrus comicus]